MEMWGDKHGRFEETGDTIGWEERRGEGVYRAGLMDLLRSVIVHSQ